MTSRTKKSILLIILVLVVSTYLFFSNIQDFILRRGIEKSNRNIHTVGIDRGDYASSRAFLMEDGSILIASALLNKPGIVSLMKLSPDLNLIWEKQLKSKTRSFWKSTIPYNSVMDIADIQIINNKCYIYAIQQLKSMYKPIFITTDLNGNLLNYYANPHSVRSHTPPKGIMMNQNAYFTWFDDDDKTVCVYQISYDYPKDWTKRFVYLIQDSLRFTSITANPGRRTVHITAFDPFKGSSLLTDSDSLGLKIINETNKDQILQLVTSIDSKLYVVATRDSSLVVGLIHEKSTEEPDKLLRFKHTSDHYLPRALLKKDDLYYFGINEVRAAHATDVKILKYNEKGLKAGEFVISGKRTETLNQLMICPDGRILAIGNTDSHRYGVGARVFATKFKM